MLIHLPLPSYKDFKQRRKEEKRKINPKHLAVIMRKTKVKLKDINCVEMLRFKFFILQMLCGMQSVSIRQSQIKQNWTACIYIYLVIRKHIPPLIPHCSWEITFWQKKPRKCDHTLKLFQKWLKEQTLHFWLISRSIHSAHFLTTWSLEEGTRHLRAHFEQKLSPLIITHVKTLFDLIFFGLLPKTKTQIF